MFTAAWCMPKLVPISHRESARKLRRAGFVEIRTSRHPVYYLAAKDLTIPVPSPPGDVPKGNLRTIVREMQISVEEFNSL
jgi:predicted RNA binding protein YcfA (HicA-like mRNA interferase family)